MAGLPSQMVDEVRQSLIGAAHSSQRRGIAPERCSARFPTQGETGANDEAPSSRTHAGVSAASGARWRERNPEKPADRSGRCWDAASKLMRKQNGSVAMHV